MVQWLRLHAPNAGGLGSIPGQGTRSCTLQLRARMPQLKDPHAATKTRRSPINIKKKKSLGDKVHFKKKKNTAVEELRYQPNGSSL